MKLTQAVLFAVATADDKKVRNINVTLILPYTYLYRTPYRFSKKYVKEGVIYIPTRLFLVKK